MSSYPHLRCLVAAIGIALAPATARAQVTVPVLVMPRHIELDAPRLDEFYLAIETPVAYPAEVDLDRSPFPTAFRAIWLAPGLRAQVGAERLSAPGDAADGFGTLIGLSYPLKRATTGFFGLDLHGELTYSRASRPDQSYRTQVDGSIGLAKVGILPAPVEIRFSVGPLLLLRRAPAPGNRSTTFAGAGLAANLFGTLKQKCVGAQLTAQWSRTGDPYRGPGHHGDFKLALGLHYEYDLIADSD